MGQSSSARRTTIPPQKKIFMKSIRKSSRKEGEGANDSQLSANLLGVSLGLTGVIFYIGCMITMATVPRDQAVIFFNSLLHGIDVDPILRQSVPIGEAVIGVVTTFALGWIAGLLIAHFYNWGRSFASR